MVDTDRLRHHSSVTTFAEVEDQIALLAVACVGQAARDGFILTLSAGTPVVPAEPHPWLTERGMWGDLDLMIRHWTEIGCRWVNLRFDIDEAGQAVVRYEAKPDGEPLPRGRLPSFNGGFDSHRHMSHDEFRRRYSPGDTAG